MLASTRFDSKTFREREEYMKRKELTCIYGTPLKIKASLPLNTILLVVEMNNEKNQIEGIGVIRNMIEPEPHYIYKDKNYNRYIYKGKYRIPRDVIEEHDKDVLEILESVVFKGLSNIKRHSGITIISKKLLECDRARGADLTERVKHIFRESVKRN